VQIQPSTSKIKSHNLDSELQYALLRMASDALDIMTGKPEKRASTTLLGLNSFVWLAKGEV
jgi:hypothetical protein